MGELEDSYWIYEKVRLDLSKTETLFWKLGKVGQRCNARQAVRFYPFRHRLDLNFLKRAKKF